MTHQPCKQDNKANRAIARIGLAALLALGSAHPTIAYAQQDGPIYLSMPKAPPESVAIGREIAMAMLNVNERERIASTTLNGTIKMWENNVVQKLVTPEERKNNPAIQTAVQTFLRDEILSGQKDLRASMAGLTDAYARAYARLFSLEQLNQIKSFVTSPTGERFIMVGTHIGQEKEVSEWYRTLDAKSEARQAPAIEKLKAELAAARSATANRK